MLQGSAKAVLLIVFHGTAPPIANLSGERSADYNSSEYKNTFIAETNTRGFDFRLLEFWWAVLFYTWSRGHLNVDFKSEHLEANP